MRLVLALQEFVDREEIIALVIQMHQMRLRLQLLQVARQFNQLADQPTRLL